MKTNFKRIFIINILGFLLLSCSKKEITIPFEFSSRPEKNNIFGYIKYFEKLNWDTSIGITEEKTIDSYIDSCHGLYHEIPIKVVVPILVHRLTNIGLRENLFEWEYIRKCLNKTKSMSELEYDKHLLSAIEIDKLSIHHPAFSHYHSIHDEVLDALVVRQCRLLRNGKKQNVIIEDSLLNSFQRRLIKYSKFPDSVAIDNLLKEISNGDYPPLHILRQYGVKGTKRVIDLIKSKNNITDKNMNVLILHLRQRVLIDLKKDEQEELLEYLMTDTVYNKRFKNQLETVAKINYLITGKDLEECEIELGIDVVAKNKRKRIYEKKKEDKIEELTQELISNQKNRK